MEVRGTTLVYTSASVRLLRWSTGEHTARWRGRTLGRLGGTLYLPQLGALHIASGDDEMYARFRRRRRRRRHTQRASERLGRIWMRRWRRRARRRRRSPSRGQQCTQHTAAASERPRRHDSATSAAAGGRPLWTAHWAPDARACGGCMGAHWQTHGRWATPGAHLDLWMRRWPGASDWIGGVAPRGTARVPHTHARISYIYARERGVSSTRPVWSSAARSPHVRSGGGWWERWSVGGAERAQWPCAGVRSAGAGGGGSRRGAAGAGGVRGASRHPRGRPASSAA